MEEPPPPFTHHTHKISIAPPPTQNSHFPETHAVRFKPDYSATETSWISGIMPVACFREPITKVLISLGGWARWSAPLLFHATKSDFFL